MAKPNFTVPRCLVVEFLNGSRDIASVRIDREAIWNAAITEVLDFEELSKARSLPNGASR